MAISPHVLLIEDNPDDELVALRTLKNLKIGAQVTVARDGEEASHLLEAPSPPYTLVLLDLKLPKIGGLDVLASARSNETLRHIPIVVLTSSDEERDIRESYRRGANGYISKPIDLEGYTEKVGTALRYWICVNRVTSESP